MMQPVTISSSAAPEKVQKTPEYYPANCPQAVSEQLARFEAALTDEEVDGEATWLFARSVQDQIHDQYRQF